MKTALVLGRGFGLYGHAAALAGLDWKVVLPEEYRPAVAERVELREPAERFAYFESFRSAANTADLVCLARRPEDNLAVAERLVEEHFRGWLVIEKPIAPDPRKAAGLASLLEANRIPYSTPYLFLYTHWKRSLDSAVEKGRPCRIRWLHPKAAASTGWKSDPAAGGGALSYYLIHALALFHGLGAQGVELIHSDACWSLSDESLEFEFRLGDEMAFEIQVDGDQVYSALSPFGSAPKAGECDPRIGPLQDFYKDVLGAGSAVQTPEFHSHVIEMWANAAMQATET